MKTSLLGYHVSLLMAHIVDKIIHLGQVDYAETAEITEYAEILLSLPNQIFTSHYNLCHGANPNLEFFFSDK